MATIIPEQNLENLVIMSITNQRNLNGLSSTELSKIVESLSILAVPTIMNAEVTDNVLHLKEED